MTGLPPVVFSRSTSNLTGLTPPVAWGAMHMAEIEPEVVKQCFQLQQTKKPPASLLGAFCDSFFGSTSRRYAHSE
jgi:hypothetical protein